MDPLPKQYETAPCNSSLQTAEIPRDETNLNYVSTETLTALDLPRESRRNSLPDNLTTSLEIPVAPRTNTLGETPKEVFTVYFSSCSVDGDEDETGSSSSDYEAVASGSTSEKSSYEDNPRYLDEELKDIYNIFQRTANNPSRDPEYQMVYYTDDDDAREHNDYDGTYFSSYDYPTYEFGDDDFELETEPENNVSRIPRLETIPEIDEEPENYSLSSSNDEIFHRDSKSSWDPDAGRCERYESGSACEHLPSVAANSSCVPENNCPEAFHTHQASNSNEKRVQSRENARTVSDSLDSLSDDEDDPNAITLPGTQLPGFEKIGARVAGKKLPDALENGHCPNVTRKAPSTSLGTQEASAQLLAESLVLNDEIVQWVKLKLRYHFMNPCQKYKAKGTKPVKLIVQIIKIFFVTLQLSLFSQYQFDFRLFVDGNFESFNHLFLFNWQSDYSDPVQRVPNPYAVYHIDDFFQSVNYAVTSYFTLTERAIGNYSYPTTFNQFDALSHYQKPVQMVVSLADFQIPPVRLCKLYYKESLDVDEAGKVELDPTKVSRCAMVYSDDLDFKNFSLQNWTDVKNFSLEWSSLIDFEVSFALINQHIGSMETYFKPVCYLFNISIKYDNSRHTGKVSIIPKYSESTTDCVSITYEYSETGQWYMICITIMDCLIIVLAIFCLFLCVRSIQHNLHLRRVTRAVWISKFGKALGKKDDAKFVQWWYIIIIIGDVALVAGSFLKMFITFRLIEDYTICALMLGCATMIVWIGVLKYLNYFHTYNALLLTLRHSMPNVLRFLVCCLFIYFGFAMAGWAVFGPFHYKFRTFVSTMETMYSLINGDDMFATFAEMRNVSPIVYWFNQIWLYVFIGLFIYCVLSLFIGIITETYEHIRESRDDKQDRMTELELFFNDMPEEPSAESFKMLKSSDAFICICCLHTDPDSIHDSIVVRARP